MSGYGNVPPMKGAGRASSPIGPGAPKNKPQPNATGMKVSSPIGPGSPKNKRQPEAPAIPNGSGKNVNRLNSIPEPPKKKASPKFRGLPGREGSVTPGKSNNGKGGQGKGSGQMKAAGSSSLPNNKGGY